MSDLLKRFGPPEQWLVSVDEIERIMIGGPCRHLIPAVGDCRECFPAALLKRQVTLLAERLGCSPEDAQAVSDKLCREFLEEW